MAHLAPPFARLPALAGMALRSLGRLSTMTKAEERVRT
jgi:hypothetical protein